MKKENNWDEVDVRDNRYNQIIHMVSAANGAEPFYTVLGHATRHEDLDGARELDKRTAEVCCFTVKCKYLPYLYFAHSWKVSVSTGFEFAQLQ